MYTIKQAATLAGLSVPVVRAWERRYGVVHPARTASGYRVYDDEAIDRLRLMQSLIGRGWSPSTAAAAIVAGTAPAIETERLTSGAGVAGIGARSDHRTWSSELRRAFVEAAASLDMVGVETVLDEMFAGGTYETVIERDVLPALQALGDAWADGRVSVAGEHAASHAVGRRLAALYQASGREGTVDGAVLVGLPPGARHELGALAFAIAARRAGLPVLYLGADLPVVDWVATAGRTRARAAVIGAVTRADRPGAFSVGRALADALPGISIAFGGRGAPDVGAASDWPAPLPVVLPDGMGDAVEMIRSAIGRGAV
jgi:MerR family transcriptional regulator, light-induced transcriptional regulator